MDFEPRVVICDANSISARLLQDWLALFNNLPEPRFYHHPRWVQSIAAHLCTEPSQIAAYYVGSQLCLIMPVYHGNGAHRLLHPQHEHLSLNDVIVAPHFNATEPCHQAIEALLKACDAHWWDWRIHNVPNQSCLFDALGSTAPHALPDDKNSQPTELNDRWRFNQTRESAYFDCATEDRPPRGKLQRNLRRLRKQMQEQGTLRIEQVSEPESILEAFHHFLEVEGSGWKGTDSAATAINANKPIQQFYASLLSPSDTLFKPIINLMWCNDDCVAVQFAIQTKTCLSLLKIGYSETYARYSPGSLLLESVMEAAANNGIQVVSLVTSPPWAERWHPNTMPVWLGTLFQDNTAGQALRHFNNVKHIAKRTLKRQHLQ